MEQVFGVVNVIVYTDLNTHTFKVKASATHYRESNWGADIDGNRGIDIEYYEDIELEESLDMYLEDLLEDYTYEELDIDIDEDSFEPDDYYD